MAAASSIVWTRTLATINVAQWIKLNAFSPHLLSTTGAMEFHVTTVVNALQQTATPLP